MSMYKFSCADAEFSRKLQNYPLTESFGSVDKNKVQELLGKDAYVTVNEQEKVITAKRILKG